MKKIALLVIIFVFLGAAQVLAFDLVEETPKTISIGATTGFLFSLNHFTSFYGIDGSYNLNERIALKASLGIKMVGSFADPDYKFFFAAKPALILLQNEENNFYANTIITNLSSSFLTIGAGFGFESAHLSNNYKTVIEIDYTLDKALIVNGGFKLYF